VVGGFGASEYLFQQIKLHVPPQFQNKVVRPMDSVAAIVKGAVTAGITERVITSRVARRHYLMATLQPFKEGHHPEQYRVPSLDGKDRCKYTRQIFVQKGQRVKIGEPVKVSFFRQVAPGATLMYEDVLYACDEDVCPEYTKDPRKLRCHSGGSQDVNKEQASRRSSPSPPISAGRTWRRTSSAWTLRKAPSTESTSTSTSPWTAPNSTPSWCVKARSWAAAPRDSDKRGPPKLPFETADVHPSHQNFALEEGGHLITKPVMLEQSSGEKQALSWIASGRRKHRQTSTQ
jgi:hypothetical protein